MSDSEHSSSPLGQELDLLPLVLDLLESMQASKDQQDLTRKVVALKAKIQQSREIVSKTPGLEYSAEEQQVELKLVQGQLESKRALLEKFKHLQILNISW